MDCPSPIRRRCEDAAATGRGSSRRPRLHDTALVKKCISIPRFEDRRERGVIASARVEDVAKLVGDQLIATIVRAVQARIEADPVFPRAGTGSRWR